MAHKSLIMKLTITSLTIALLSGCNSCKKSEIPISSPEPTTIDSKLMAAKALSINNFLSYDA